MRMKCYLCIFKCNFYFLSRHFSSCVPKESKSTESGPIDRMISCCKSIVKPNVKIKGLCFDVMDCVILFSVCHVYIPSSKVHGRNKLEIVEQYPIHVFTFGDISFCLCFHYFQYIVCIRKEPH